MKRNRLLFVLIAIMALVLSACATGVEPTATRVAPTTAATAVEEAATDEVEATTELEATEELEALTEEADVEETDEAELEATEELEALTEEADVEETEESEVRDADATEEGTEVGLLTTAEGVETEEAELEATVEEAETEEADLEATEEEVATEEADLVATDEEVMTEEATMEMTEEEVMTEEATMEMTEEMDMTEEMTVEPMVTDEMTEEATMEMTEEMDMTEEMTVEPMVTDEMMTEEATMEMTEEEVMTEEATMEATMDMTAEGTSEAGVGGDTLDLAGSITSVCLVTDTGRVNDGTFNQFAYNGMVRAAEEFTLDTDYIETEDPVDYAANIETCLDTGAGAVVTVGFLIADTTLAAAEANPDVYFIGVDQFFDASAPDNLVGLQYREDQAGFLVGAMAALMSESGTVGGVYGVEIPPVVKLRHGFESGARYINPDIETLGVYIPSFTAPAEGAANAENMIGEGADVIFGAGGGTGSGGILRAAELETLVIGVDQDEYFTTFGGGATPGAEYIITSAVKRVDQGVYDMLDALTEGNVGWPTGGIYILDASNQGITFAPANAAEVPEEVTAQVQELLDQMAAGELETGIDPVTGAYLDAELEEAEVDLTLEATPEMEATESMDATEEMEATEDMEMTEEADMDATMDMTPEETPES